MGTVFFLNGLVLASWVPHIPLVKAAHGLGDGALGGVLFAMAIGAVTVLPAAGWLVSRGGSRRVTLLAAATLALALPLPVLAPSAALVAGALWLLGAANATLDVAMNAQGVAVEAALGRPVLSSFHGLFSLGGLVGRRRGGGRDGPRRRGARARARRGAREPGVLLAMRGGLLPAPPSAHVARARLRVAPAAAPRARRPDVLRVLAEGAMGDWSAVYLHDDLGAAPALAGAGFAAFSLAMAVGRFSGDHLAARLGPARLLRLSGGLAAVGLAAALVMGRPEAAIAGPAWWGSGSPTRSRCCSAPRAGCRDSRQGWALAAVATTGYGGFLVGPPAIGLVADAVGLPAALGLVALACALIGIGAGLVSQAVRRACPPTTRPLAPHAD